MDNNISLAIVIPCFNEGNRLPLKDFEAFLNLKSSDAFFVFVNDGSSDNTEEILGKLKDRFKNSVEILNLSKNSGKAEAVRQGMLWLEKNKSDFDYAVFMDADLSTPLSQLKSMPSKISQYKNPGMLMGSRVKIYGSTDIQRSELRHYFGRIVATLISKSLKLPVYDTQCGFKLFRRDLIPVLFKEEFISKWLFDVELIFRLIQHLGRESLSTQLFEIPMDQWHEKGGSKINWTYSFRMPFELMRIKRKYT